MAIPAPWFVMVALWVFDRLGQIEPNGVSMDVKAEECGGLAERDFRRRGAKSRELNGTLHTVLAEAMRSADRKDLHRPN
jgi:hypothetical protein